MPLAIEVNHVLGRRSLLLASRDVEAPVLVGRSRDCDVQIPSVSVGSPHCVLFVHDRQWLVQESDGAAVTINGQAIAGPVGLNIGDVIGIGDDPKSPTIQIDPAAAAAGKAGPAIETTPPGEAPVAGEPAVIAGSRRPLRPPSPTPIVDDAPPQLAPSRRPQAPPPLLEEPDEEVDSSPVAESFGEMAEPEGDTIDFGQTAAVAAGIDAPASPYRRRAKSKSSGAGAMVVLFILVLGALGIAIAFAINHRNKLDAEAKAIQANNRPKPAPVVRRTDRAPDGPGSKVFVLPTGDPTPSDSPPAGSTAPPPVPTPAPTDPGSSGDSSPSPAGNKSNAPQDSILTTDDTDPNWLQVLTARHGDPAIAIYRYQDYRENNGDKHKDDLDKLDDEAANYLWWHRIRHLFNQRKTLDKSIADLHAELAHQREDDFKKQLKVELAEDQSQRGAADEALNDEFHYRLDTPPDVDNPTALDKLKDQRDAGAFAKWKKKTLTWIREHNGMAQWPYD